MAADASTPSEAGPSPGALNDVNVTLAIFLTGCQDSRIDGTPRWDAGEYRGESSVKRFAAVVAALLIVVAAGCDR